MRFESLAFVRVVHVYERVRRVAEVGLGEAQLPEPGVDLATACSKIGLEAWRHASAQQQEHGLLPPPVGRHCDVRLRIDAGVMHPASEIGSDQRRVTGHGQQEFRLEAAQAGQHARQRTEVAVQRVWNHRMAEGGIAIEIPVRVDQYRTDLWSQCVQHVLDHRPAEEFHEPLVLTAHAPRESARQDQPGDGAWRKARLRWRDGHAAPILPIRGPLVPEMPLFDTEANDMRDKLTHPKSQVAPFCPST